MKVFHDVETDLQELLYLMVDEDDPLKRIELMDHIMFVLSVYKQLLVYWKDEGVK